jgi:predicted 2-oxoglutarate/Fe(II)-dependent dioxygenase YbiX
MMRIIPGLLKPAEVKEIVDALELSEFVDGRSSAGRKARQVKKNQHLVQGIHGDQEPERDRQVDVAAHLWEFGRCQVNHDLLGRQG